MALTSSPEIPEMPKSRGAAGRLKATDVMAIQAFVTTKAMQGIMIETLAMLKASGALTEAQLVEIAHQALTAEAARPVADHQDDALRLATVETIRNLLMPLGLRLATDDRRPN
jgi:hypothetical protein